ncbi:MAG: DHH family phosphoesterase [Candidatus Desulfovibrio kirbyi]|uniref:DHH family phosphoesterase n=1 Tax=Candidatus Desulfovibrio kirbyi TaxID=2696086 RepID=A0A6L2R7A0_9BACT|nr:MAG: DHH family phosphoesterase [Candidatus Desulfovibrio kirbyi]
MSVELPFETLPARFQEGAQCIANALNRCNRVVVSGHINADGDSVASLAAAGLILCALGKEYALYSSTGIPDYLSFIPATVCTSLKSLPFAPRSALILDCCDIGRLSAELAACLPKLSSVNVDHHLGGEGLGNLANWVQPESAATAQLMAYVALACHLPLEGRLADAVALGIVSDTGGFCHSTTDEHVFRLATHLAAGGCNIPQLREKLEARWSVGQMRLWARLMRRSLLLRNASVIFCAVRLRDFRECGATKEDMEGFVEQLRRLRGVKVAALLREEKPSLCKFSLRSFGATNVQAAAASLNGGGHRNAAGGTLRLALPQARISLLAAIMRRLDSEEARN